MNVYLVSERTEEELSVKKIREKSQKIIKQNGAYIID